MGVRSFVGVLASAAVVLGCGIYFLGGMSHVSIGNVGIVKHLDGQVTLLEQGYHWTGWGVSVQEYPTYTQVLVLSSVNTEGGTTNQAWEIGTKDNQDLPINTSLNWRIDPTQAAKVYQSIGGQDIGYIRDNIVLTKLKAIANKVSHDYNWQDIKGPNLAEVQQKIEDQLREALAENGIIVEKGGFGITKVEMPAGMQQAQQGIAQAEANVKTAQAKQDAAKIDNQTLIMNAEAQATAAEKEAEGIKAKAQALNQYVVEEDAISRWNGQVSQVSGGSGGNMMFNIPLQTPAATK